MKCNTLSYWFLPKRPIKLSMPFWISWKKCWDFDDLDDLNLNEFYSKSWSWFRDIYKLRFIMNQDFFINRSPKIFFWLFMSRFFKKKSCLLVFICSNLSWYDFYTIPCIHEMFISSPNYFLFNILHVMIWMHETLMIIMHAMIKYSWWKFFLTLISWFFHLCRLTFVII